MNHSATESAGDGVAWLLLAAGVTFQPSQYFGGLFFALACAMLTRHWLPEKGKREVWLTLLCAFLVATLGAEIYIWQYPEQPFPVQMVMAGLGLVSRVAMTIVMKVLMGAEERSDEIAKKVIDERFPRKDGS